MDFLSDLVGIHALYVSAGGDLGTGVWQGPASVMWWHLLGESFDFLVFWYKPLYSTRNVLAIKLTLLQCKCSSKLRHSEVLGQNREGRAVYEDKLPAQGDVWGGQCHPGTGHSKLECFQKLAELRHCWASPGDSWLYVG